MCAKLEIELFEMTVCVCVRACVRASVGLGVR